MFTPVSERAKNLDKRLDQLCTSITEAYNINEEDLQPVSQPLQSTVIVCGRICREEQTEEDGVASSSGPLSSSLFLEGSRKHGNTAGLRILLDFSSWLFPFPVSFDGYFFLYFIIIPQPTLNPCTFTNRYNEATPVNPSSYSENTSNMGDGEPAFTTYHHRFKGTVDYVW